MPASLTVRVQPGARRNEVVGFEKGVLRLRIKAPPAEGKANEALLAFVAELLGIRPRHLTIVRGVQSREKVLQVEGVEQDEMKARLTSLDDRKP